MTRTTRGMRVRLICDAPGFATVACAAERDLMAVQQLLGPAKPRDTAVYARARVPDGSLPTAVRATSAWRP